VAITHVALEPLASQNHRRGVGGRARRLAIRTLWVANLANPIATTAALYGCAAARVLGIAKYRVGSCLALG